MEEIFKNKLRSLQGEILPTTFGEALIGHEEWFLAERNEISGLNEPQISEKSLVIDSFSRFAQEKIQDSETRSFGFPGGVIAEKAPDNSLLWQKKYQSREEFLKAFILSLPEEMQDFTRNKCSTQLKMIVLTESRLDVNERSSSALSIDYTIHFKSDVAELLFKMIEALKVSPHEYIIFSTSEFSQDDLFEFIYWIEPQIVVPLGASPAKKVMNAQEKLSQIHGKLTHVPLAEKMVKMIPLFHPSVLVGNLNMKKTTWIDMQEIIKILHT